jgi:hypothetical protein
VSTAAGPVQKHGREKISSAFEPSPFWLRRMPNPLAMKARHVNHARPVVQRPNRFQTLERRRRRRSEMWTKLALVLALAAAPLTAAKSDTLTVGQAKTTALADWYANIHYTALEESGEVVITIAPGADEAGRPMRVVSRLADGQSQTISIGGYGENTRLTTLTVTRVADQVSFDVDSRNVSQNRKTAGLAN